MKRNRASLEGFTLIELMVALMLGAMISVIISFISSMCRESYTKTVQKVQVYNSFRIVFSTIQKDLAGWIPTRELEFYVDGKGSRPRDFHWQPGEEVSDRSDEFGKGVVDGGVKGEYDEFAFIEQRQYRSRERYQVERGDPVLRFHDAYRVYLKTLTYVDGAIREANVEYMLVDTSAKQAQWIDGVPPPPVNMKPGDVQDLALYKIVRYFLIDKNLLTNMNQYPIKRRVLEVASNVTDFRVEYLTHNPFSKKAKSRFVTPEEDYEKYVEEVARPKRIKNLGVRDGFRKVFGYGSVKLEEEYPLATAFYAGVGDNQIRNLAEHRPVRFGFLNDPMIQFGELSPGDRIFIFTDNSLGGGVQVQGAGGNAIADRLKFPPGDYTVKGNRNGMLEFLEDINSSGWGEKDQRPLRYKAAILPSALRVTVRMVDDKGLNPKTMQQVIRLRRKAR